MEPTKLISLADFQRIQFVAARIASVKVNKTARVPAYLCSLELGTPLMEEHQRLHGKSQYFSSAQLTAQHTKEEVDGKTLLTVANFPRKQIGPRMSDCLITGVQTTNTDTVERTASTVLVQCSHNVQPGLLVTLTGKSEHLHANSRDLTWQDFIAASIKVGTVTDARLDTSIQHIESGLAAYIACIDFGASTGVQIAHATLDSKVFASPDALLHKQMLAVTNLVNNDNSVTPIILSVGGQAVLQPAKPVANGYVLA